MKVIDLLNKIANGEELPKTFEYNDKIWRLASNRTYFIGSDYGYDFWVEHNNDKFEDEVITLNDEIKIIEEDTPKEDKKIENTARFQYSQIPSWFDIKELTKAVNENFERHQKALNEIINKYNMLMDRLNGEDNE